jgi:hypothetical protein
MKMITLWLTPEEKATLEELARRPWEAAQL